MNLDDPIWVAVFEYSEWLDSEQKLLTPQDGDERTHEDLVNQFMEEREGQS